MLFISYSHENAEFADTLIARLIKERVAVWYDKVEIKVGESLFDRIQGAIQAADYLAIVLSKASVQSAWCKEELKAGLLRQLEARRVVVLPLLIEDCDIPLFLREKKYADFRADFEKGFQQLRQAIAAAAEANLGTRDTDDYQVDYAFDWNVIDDALTIELDGVSFSKKNRFSVMTQIRLAGNEVATRRYREYAKCNLGEAGVAVVVAGCQEVFDVPDACVSLENKPITVATQLRDEKTGLVYDISIWSRRIGEPTATPLLFHFGAIFGDILREFVKRQPPMTETDRQNLRNILLRPAH